MSFKFFLVSLIVLLVIGCRERTSEDYNYFKPYQKAASQLVSADTLQSPDSVKVVATAKPPIAQFAGRGADLTDSYFIVVASYVMEEYALAQKQRLIEQGFKPEIFMINEDGWYKLAVLSYKTLAEAEAGLKKLIENKVVAPDARIVVRKSKP